MNLIKNLIPKKYKNKARSFYGKYLQFYHEKLQFINFKFPQETSYLYHLKNKTCLEIGGPSFFFRNVIRTYNVLKSVDNVNYAQDTIWKLKTKSGEKNIYNFHKTKDGYQYLSEGNNLNIIKNNSYDCIMSCHVIEHLANPIGAILEWKKKIKNNGYFLSVIPYAKYTFDHKRPITKISHLIEDYEKNMQENDQTHLEEIISLHDFSLSKWDTHENILKHAKNNAQTRILHHHVFDLNLVEQIYEFCKIRILLKSTLSKILPSVIILGVIENN